MNIPKTNRFYFIDFIETVAIFSVIFYHVFSTSVDVREYEHIGNYYIKSWSQQYLSHCFFLAHLYVYLLIRSSS